MGKQQTRRRKKRYQPGSAYAGDVKPTGFLGFLGSARTMRVVFVVMAVALVGGGAAAVFRGGLGGSNASAPNFVLPPDKKDTPTAEAAVTAELKQYAQAPAMTIDPSKTYYATITTADGDIKIQLDAAAVPQTVNNFVFLANDGFYNGLAFYRVTDGFTAQAGDPACTANSTNCAGRGGPGYDLAQEKPGAFAVGTVGMANASQFFIALTDSDQFAQFTPFGKIVSGLDVAQKLKLGTEITAVQISEQ